MTNKEAIERLIWVRKRICDITYSPESFEAINLAIKALEERPKGKWIEGELDGMLLGLVPYYWYNCSECGYHFSLNRGSKKPNYCQECGADMRGDV